MNSKKTPGAVFAVQMHTGDFMKSFKPADSNAFKQARVLDPAERLS
jgi:hypothetical protein